MSVYYRTAGAFALLHGLGCVLGALGFGMTADHAEPMSTDEASTVSLLIFVVGVVTIVGASMPLGGTRPVTLLVGVFASLAVSGYVAVRWIGRVDGFGYQVPLSYAVIPVLVIGLVFAGSRRAPITAAG
ncbi:hypothetical protein [Pseudonocardia sp. KRD291]|uniref:hypothetical protein n=1 Tax=Pseudonocardia sp. KRD291 TaxID=2792007 RepID=UPI001C4A6D5E|nr:hypothetical protein [Pseudonocardia sp. KRD291]MBW0101955.1 hypothetical protein [Pseudonocardia sp. KRD291]